MKKIFLVSMVCLLMMAIAAPIALADEADYTFKLSYSPSENLEVGDVITVTFDLINNDNVGYKMYMMQNEVLFDKEYFELVAGSITVAEGFSSGIRDNTRDTGRVVMINFIDQSKRGVDRPAQMFAGSFRLKIIKPCQDINIINQDFYLTDAEANDRPVAGENIVIDAVLKSAPALSTEVIVLGDDAVVSFTDNAAWRAAIQDVELDGESVVAYTIIGGSITLDGSLFPAVGNYNIKIIAEWYEDAVTTQEVIVLSAPPSLSTDAIMLGSNAVVSFTDDATWRAAIQDVELDGASVAYTIIGGSITLDASLFPAAGNYEIKVIAAGYTDAVVMQAVVAPLAPPALSTEVINPGNDVLVSFTDDATWRAAIQDVELDGASVAYTQSAGSITLAASLFPAVGNYEIKVIAAGYTDAVVMQAVVAILAPPTLNTSVIKPGDNAIISFTDDAAWRTVIQDVKLDGDSVVAYTIVGGSITLDASLFPAVGNYEIKVIAAGYTDAVVMQAVVAILAPPTLNTSVIMLGDDAVIRFTNDAAWREAIQDVEIDGVSAIFIAQNGRINIDGSCFTAAGDHEIKVIAEGYANAVVTQEVTALYAPPALSTEVIALGENAIIRFTDDEAWRGAIWRVAVNGSSVSYSLSEGIITLNAARFPDAGNYEIKVFATRYENAVATQVVIVPSVPPALSTNVIMLGDDAAISFTDDAVWSAAVQDVKLDGESVAYTLTEGSITLDGSLFPAAGNYEIKVIAAGYVNAVATQEVTAPSVPPALSTNAIVPGSNAVISFTDDAAWREAIQGVEVNGVSVAYTLTDGKITLDGSLFPNAGNYDIKVIAEGYTNAAVTQEVKALSVPPVLTASSITRGSNAVIRFTDDAVWRAAIRRVEINGESVAYTPAAGSITLAASLFPAVGNYDIKIIADWYVDATVTQAVTAPYVPPGNGGDSGNGNGPGTVIDIEDNEVPLAEVSAHIRYIYGYEDGTFGPEKNITRAEVAVIFYRLTDESHGVDEGPYKTAFSDVAVGSWYYDAVAYLEHYKILAGYPDGTFRPNDFISRAEFAKIAAVFAGLSNTVTLTFPDVPTSHWAAGYILSAADKGWVTGFPDGTFRPEDKITRVQVVTIINRMMERSIEKEDIPATALKFPDVPESHWGYADVVEASSEHVYTRKENGYELWDK